MSESDVIRAALETVRVRELAQINSARLVDAILAVLDACDIETAGLVEADAIRRTIENALRGGR